jgi:hypothetical protein
MLARGNLVPRFFLLSAQEVIEPLGKPEQLHIKDSSAKFVFVFDST